MKHSKDLTYRVRQIPFHYVDDDLKELLSNGVPTIGSRDSINILSFATGISSFQQTKVATISFGLEVLPSWMDAGNEWKVRSRDGQITLLLDTHFFGFTVLNEAEPHTLDCIFIHGLNGHPLGSWADKKQAHFGWVRDKLPVDVKQARCILYGYDSHLVGSESFQSIEDIDRALISQLGELDQSLEIKPIILLAHSLGGILLKSALRRMAANRHPLMKSIREIIFFGVPNRGMHISHLLPMVEGQPNESFVRVLERESRRLELLDAQFSNITLHWQSRYRTERVRLVSFYETKRSETTIGVKYSTEKGRWEATGPTAVLVEKTSAIQSGTSDLDQHSINDTHSNMVKFTENSVAYQTVARYIRDEVQTEVHSISFGTGCIQDSPTILSKEPKNVVSHDDAREMMVSLALQNSTVTYRFDEIKLPHKQTFNWIWGEDSPFVAWLKSDLSIFWIRGKPGSGKSTLMKHIVHTYGQRRILYPQPSGDQPTIIPFSFYDLGSDLQKSIDGFMFALLNACLDKDRRLAQCVLPIFQRHEKRWTTRSLREAVETALNQKTVPVQFILFLDALDECAQPLNELVDFVSQMTNPGRKSATHMRICLSSRPYNVFIDAFESYPGLNIHQHTTEDMVYYIKQRFASSIPMSALMDQDQKVGNSQTVTTTLINRLVNTAEGVFLWLRLAVDDILDEAQDGAASVADTLKHFESLGLEEPDLEIMYSRILDKTPAQFRKQAYIMLELVLRSYVPISTYDFWLAESCARCQKLEDCLDEMPVKALVSQELFDTLHFGPDVPVRYATEQVLTPPVDSQERRLRSRCRGLLERSQADQPRDGKGSEHVVKFMHRSVKEFLIKTGMHARWAERTSVTENGYTFLAKYGLAQLTVERRRYYDPLHLAGQIVYKTMPAWFYYLHYFSMAEATTGTSQKSLLDSATEAFAPSQNEDEDIFGLYGSALSFGVVTNLLLYVRESLVNDDTGIAAELLGQQNLEINTLLHDVVRGTVKSRCYLPGDPDRAITYSAFGGSFPVNDLTQMANLLLENGANMDSVFVGYTPFQLLLSASEESYRGVGKAWQTSPIALVRVFLKHGQHPDSTLNMSKTDITPALHLCDSTMASILLKSGARVNSLDSVGLTALDVAFGARGNIFNVEYPATAKEAYNLILLLLRHGGRVTEAGILSLPKFHKALFRSSRYSRKTVDPRVLKPPRMEGL